MDTVGHRMEVGDGREEGPRIGITEVSFGFLLHFERRVGGAFVF